MQIGLFKLVGYILSQLVVLRYQVLRYTIKKGGKIWLNKYLLSQDPILQVVQD